MIAIFILTLLNGTFSLAEMAVVSSRRAKLQAMAEDGHYSPVILLKILANPAKFLSTIQVAITAIAIVTGFLGGAAVAEQVGKFLQEIIPAYARYATPAAIFLVVLTTTFLSIVIGELVPKDIALTQPEAIACFMARPLAVLMWLLSPFSLVLSGTSGLILAIFRVKRHSQSFITEEEIRIMLREGQMAGSVHESEKSMVENVFNLDDSPVAHLMTPRSQVLWISAESSDKEIFKIIQNSPHSYYPVCENSFDKVVGVFPVKAALKQISTGNFGNLKDLLFPALFVPESMRASKLLELFKQKSQHFAIVVDEYGVAQGVVTLHNILEAIVGDFPTSQNQDTTFIEREDGSYLIDGTVPVADFTEKFSLSRSAFEQDPYQYTTLAGLVTAHLQKIPSAGDKIHLSFGRLEVMDMDGVRVDKLLYTPQ